MTMVRVAIALDVLAVALPSALYLHHRVIVLGPCATG